MAWIIWLDDGRGESYRSYAHMGFFCNTMDVCFGPVFYVDSCFDKGTFYKMWEKAGFDDPRKLFRSDDITLWEKAHHIINLMDYGDNIQATMKVFNQGKLLYEESTKDCYPNISFSPHQKELESQSEDDFEMICSLIEDCESDMKTVLLTDPDTTTAWMKSEYKDFNLRVEMEWEVLDEC